jgi:mono/diheme cytochrome c family protein
MAIDTDQAHPIHRLLSCRRVLKAWWTMLRLSLCQALIGLILTAPVLAASPVEQRGKAYARSHCARCHAIDRTARSPFQPAPPFRTLHQRYPIETLGESLAEGIDTGHPAMPGFQLDPNEIHDLLSYLKTLE